MMTDRSSVEEKIGGIFEQRLNLTVPSSSVDLFESGGLDSLSFVELLLQLELEYGLKIPLQDIELADFRSIERIADFIKQRLDARNARPEPQYTLSEVKCPA